MCFLSTQHEPVYIKCYFMSTVDCKMQNVHNKPAQYLFIIQSPYDEAQGDII